MAFHGFISRDLYNNEISGLPEKVFSELTSLQWQISIVPQLIVQKYIAMRLVAPVILKDSHTRLNGIWEVVGAMLTYL